MTRWCCASLQSGVAHHPVAHTKPGAGSAPKAVPSANARVLRDVHAVLCRRQALLGAAGLLSLGEHWLWPRVKRMKHTLLAKIPQL